MQSVTEQYGMLKSSPTTPSGRTAFAWCKHYLRIRSDNGCVLQRLHPYQRHLMKTQLHGVQPKHNVVWIVKVKAERNESAIRFMRYVGLHDHWLQSMTEQALERETYQVIHGESMTNKKHVLLWMLLQIMLYSLLHSILHALVLLWKGQLSPVWGFLHRYELHFLLQLLKRCHGRLPLWKQLCKIRILFSPLNGTTYVRRAVHKSVVPECALAVNCMICI